MPEIILLKGQQIRSDYADFLGGIIHDPRGIEDGHTILGHPYRTSYTTIITITCFRPVYLTTIQLMQLPYATRNNNKANIL